MTKNKIKKSLSLIAVSAATALSLVGMSITPSTFVSAGQRWDRLILKMASDFHGTYVSLLREKWNLKFPEAFIK